MSRGPSVSHGPEIMRSRGVGPACLRLIPAPRPSAIQGASPTHGSSVSQGDLWSLFHMRNFGASADPRVTVPTNGYRPPALVREPLHEACARSGGISWYGSRCAARHIAIPRVVERPRTVDGLSQEPSPWPRSGSGSFRSLLPACPERGESVFRR